MTGSVEHKVVIVTGSCRGIGAGIAADLAEKDAKVVIVDLNADAAQMVADGINADGGSAIAVAVDVSDRQSVKAMIERAVSHFGRLDVMFNNAGISQTCPFMAHGLTEKPEQAINEFAQSIPLGRFSHPTPRTTSPAKPLWSAAWSSFEQASGG